jgi:Ribosomal protein L5
MIPRLREKYKTEIVKSLMNKLSLTNSLSVPKIEKVVINMGLGIDALDKKILETCVKDISAIAGQHPVITKFKKSISNFKTRKGGNAGLKVTLRNDRMYEFIDRLVNIALPRIKDFRGLKDTNCDKFGNFSFGIKSI